VRLDHPAAEVVDAAHAYSAYAAHYDGILRENRINAYLRRETTKTLHMLFDPGSRLLELGCGTGDEALALADDGCEVVALDPSSEMIRIAESKAAKHHRGGHVRFVVGTSHDAANLLADTRDGHFDGAYSSFALSYEADLRPLCSALARLVRMDGRLVVAAMNRLCLSESLLSLLFLRPGLAGRRLSPWTTHKVGQVRTVVYPRTAEGLSRQFRPAFAVEESRSLCAILPPHYANRPLRRWPALVDMMQRIDEVVGRRRVFRDLGDHELVVMRRVG